MSEHDAEKNTRKVLIVALIVFVSVIAGVKLATAGATGIITPNSHLYPLDLYFDGVKCRICGAFGDNSLVSAHLSNLEERLAEILWAVEEGKEVEPAVKAYETELDELKEVLTGEVTTLTLLDVQKTISKHYDMLTPYATTLDAVLKDVDKVANLTNALIEKRTAEKLAILAALEEKIMNASIKVEFPIFDVYPEGLTLVIRDRGRVVRSYVILINASAQEVYLERGRRGELIFVDLECLEAEDLRSVANAVEDQKISMEDLAVILKAQSKLLGA
ncbi:MAG: hypothetical protein DRN91_02955 [Candidatus Alkanophagales archaeon]|nr:MAG: hypothetical protein DRN91_02955 [Candidatus Alkanophagales archaeon]